MELKTGVLHELERKDALYYMYMVFSCMRPSNQTVMPEVLRWEGLEPTTATRFQRHFCTAAKSA